MKNEATAGEWHQKPNTGGPCSVCGCPAKRLKALHKQTDESSPWGAGWVKSFRVCFGQDSTQEKYGTIGWPSNEQNDEWRRQERARREAREARQDAATVAWGR